VVPGYFEGNLPVYLNKSYDEPSIELMLKGKCSTPRI